MYLNMEQGSTIFVPKKLSSTFTTVSFAISTLGLALSILALLLLLVTACMFREWRNSHKNQVLIQFMCARCFYTFIRYHYDVRLLLFNTSCPDKKCIIYMDELLMIYSEVVLVAWMYIFSKQMYNSLVVVLSPSFPAIWKVSVATWITPAIVTLVMYALYYWQDGSDIVSFFLYLATVKWPVLVANATVLIMILKSLTKSNNINGNQTNNLRFVLVMNFLIWSFCIQQVFVDVYKIVYVALNDMPTLLLYLFNICTMYHCAFCVMFWIFGNAKTRKMWRNKFCCVVKVPLSAQSSLNSSK